MPKYYAEIKTTDPIILSDKFIKEESDNSDISTAKELIDFNDNATQRNISFSIEAKNKPGIPIMLVLSENDLTGENSFSLTLNGKNAEFTYHWYGAINVKAGYDMACESASFELDGFWLAADDGSVNIRWIEDLPKCIVTISKKKK
jgi:hypothetical protein